MNPQPPRNEDAEFDRFVDSYEACVDEHVGWAGGSARYFARVESGYALKFLKSQNISNPHILDFGCGIGIMTDEFAKLAPSNFIFLGYDPSVRSIRKAEKENAHKNARYTSDTGSIPKNKFNAAIMRGVLHHTPLSEQSTALQQVMEYLMPGGFLIIFEHNPYNPLTQYVFKNNPIDAEAKMITFGECGRLLRANGLDILRGDYTIFFPGFLSALQPLEPWLNWCPLGAHYTYVTRKRA